MTTGAQDGAVALPRTEAAKPTRDQLYRWYVQDVARWLQHRLGPRAPIEDLTHDVFIIAFRNLPRFRGDASPRTWLYRITINVVRNHRRKRKVRSIVAALTSDVVSDRPPQDRVVDAQAKLRTLQDALQRLSPRYREVLLGYELDGLSTAELAEVFGARQQTVWVWLHRARKALHQELESAP